MILNHQYNFLFVKTRKTGGTSLEIALSKFCGPQDIITPFRDEDEKIRQKLGYRGPQNYMASHGKSQKAWHHIPAAEITKKISEKDWGSLYKFAVIRNPFSKAVSAYYWRGGSYQYGSFLEFLKSDPKILRHNWEIICVGGKPALDKIVRFERLREDLTEVSETLELPENVYDVMRGIHAKGQYRPKRKSIREFFEESDKARQLVELLCEEELAYFEYSLADLD